MHWSILIAGIPERYATVQPLLYKLLETQGVGRMPDVEFLYLMDNKRRPVGTKRNDLIDSARGEYVSFIDDDDDVGPDYVRRIYRAIRSARKAETQPDVICFRQTAKIGNTGVIHDCRYSLEYYTDREAGKRRQLSESIGEDGKPMPNVLLWTGPPAHTMAWRRETVAGVWFPEETFGEDVAWVDSACGRAKTEVQIEGEPLYIYQFNPDVSATRG